MFKNLFGGSKKDQKKEFDPFEVKQKLDEKCQDIELRIQKMEQDQEALKKEAIEKKKANQSRIAVVKLKKSKLCEKEIAKLEGQLMMLEQQKMLIESANWD